MNCATIKEKYLIRVREKQNEKNNKTIVDSNTSCVRAYCCDEKNEERDYEGKSLTHYTRMSSLLSILERRRFFAKTILYHSQEKTIPNRNSLLGQLFFVAFTKQTDESLRMWENVKKDCNVKVDVLLKNTVADLIDTVSPFYTTNKINGDAIDVFKHLHNHNNNIKTTKNIFVSTKFIEQSYVNDDQAYSMKNLKNTEECFVYDNQVYDIIGHTGSHELKQWSYQEEIKLIAKLMSAEPIAIDACTYLSVPIKFDDVVEMIITLKEPYLQSEYLKLYELINTLQPTKVDIRMSSF